MHLTGGGGGGGSHNHDDANGGGGAGGTAVKLIAVTPGTKFTYDLAVGGRGAFKEGYGARSGALNGAHSYFRGVDAAKKTVCSRIAQRPPLPCIASSFSFHQPSSAVSPSTCRSLGTAPADV